MTELEPVSRREFVVMFDRLSDRIEHVRELVRQAELNSDKALIIRTTEIERRLTALNHEYQRAAEERARVVSAATWNEFIKGFDEWRTGVNDFRSNWQGKVAIMVVIASAFVSVAVSLILRTLQ